MVFQTLNGEAAVMAYVCFIVSAGLHDVNVPLHLLFLPPVTTRHHEQQVADIADLEAPLAEREDEHGVGHDKAQSASLERIGDQFENRPAVAEVAIFFKGIRVISPVRM